MSLIQTKMPECEKLAAIKDEGQVIGEFLEWLEGKGWFLCEYKDDYCKGNMPLPVIFNKDRLLAEYFYIDLKKVEAERCALLEEIRRNV
jgi:hypothetical protein